MSRVLVMVGTVKGAFFLWSDERRQEWRVDGPLIKGWEVTTVSADLRSEPVLWAGVGSMVYGANLQRSTDLGESWSQIEDGPRYREDSGRTLERIWTVQPGHRSRPDVLFAGVAEAGLFRSSDRGDSWSEVDGLNDHPTRQEWFPGAGGLCCHTVLIDPENADRTWAGISAVGTFRSDDDGRSWEPKNHGIDLVSESEVYSEIGCCVHKMVVDPNNSDRLFQQNHTGVFRSTDAGDSWQRIENGIPSSFGFPIVMDPHDSETLFVIPQESDEFRFFLDGELIVYRSRDGGDSWQPLRSGLPDRPTYDGVLRGAMSVDDLDRCGVYFGTSGGQVYYSRDAGDSWHEMPCRLPRISSVTAVTLR